MNTTRLSINGRTNNKRVIFYGCRYSFERESRTKEHFRICQRREREIQTRCRDTEREYRITLKEFCISRAKQRIAFYIWRDLQRTRRFESSRSKRPVLSTTESCSVAGNGSANSTTMHYLCTMYLYLTVVLFSPVSRERTKGRTKGREAAGK